MCSRPSDQGLQSLFAMQPKRSKAPEVFRRDLFIDRVPEEILCRICSQVNKKPLSCVDCSSTFCKECIEKARGSPIYLFNSSDISCPSCHHRTIREAPRALRKRIESLEIKCIECQETVQLAQIKDHYNLCSFATVPCSNRTCRKYGLRKHFITILYTPPWISASFCKTQYLACSQRCKMLLEFELILKDDKTRALEFYRNLLSSHQSTLIG